MSLFSVSRTVSVKRAIRYASTVSDKQKYKIVVVGGGTGGLSVANQIYDRFKAAGQSFGNEDIAILDANEYHSYQPGWTLVGAGLKDKKDTRRHLEDLIPKYVTRIPENVRSFSPKTNSVTTTRGRTISYDALVVAAGIGTYWDKIQGLSSALVDSYSGVSSIYSYETCDKTWADIESLRAGRAIFTQPQGVIKCAGAPQKIMWMAWDRFRKTGRGDKIHVDFFTGMPTMFSVKKYSDALNELRQERGVGGFFKHNLIAVDGHDHKATFQKPDGSVVETEYNFLHVTPPMGPPQFLKQSPIVDKDGWVSVNPNTLRHTNPEFGNIFALGDCSSLPTSKTAAAITSQAPVLTESLFHVMHTGASPAEAYDGYTSCPLLTGYGELMLTEFKYGLEPKESFNQYFGDQTNRRRLFYHLKKDVFPRAYWAFMVRGKWFGVHGLSRPSFAPSPSS